MNPRELCILGISVEFQGPKDEKEWPKQERQPGIAVYVFDPSGRLVVQKPLKTTQGKPPSGSMKIEVEAIRGFYVVMIAPENENVKNLEPLGKNPTQKVEGSPGEHNLEFVIPWQLWHCWILVPYVVAGTVEKDGIPVCFGEVEIYDVEIWPCFRRLPPFVIERIRDGIIDVIRKSPLVQIKDIPAEWSEMESWDDDWCGTPPQPPVPPKGPTTVEKIDEIVAAKLKSLPKEWNFAKERQGNLPLTREMMRIEIEKKTLDERRAFLASEPVEGVKVAQIIDTTTEQFRNLLIDKFQAFRYWLCWYPWIYYYWWWWCRYYSRQLLGTAELQPDGSFHKQIYVSLCSDDIPDLWFKVKQNINGVEKVIYNRYPVPCNTYWNHPSGHPVHLHVTHPDTVVCQHDVPLNITDAYIMPMGIYEDEWYSVNQAHIKAHCDPATPLPAACGLYNGTDPYGTRLDIRMQLDPRLRTLISASNGVRFYRWSYRKHGTTNWSAIDTPIVHRYIAPVSPGKYAIIGETLGPNENNMFAVPDPAKNWLANRDDLAYAIWNTAIWDASQGRYVSLVSDGKYDLCLEVFDKDGNKLIPSAAGFKFVLPTAAVGVVDDSLFVEADGSLICHIHVDNKATVADIKSIALNGLKALECQFLGYSDKANDNVDIEYEAYHPTPSYNFLYNYVLTVRRGISGTQEGYFSSTVSAPTPAVYSFKVKDLLDTYGKCAFSVRLETYPRTRDGHSRIRAYEASDNSSFALVET